MREIWVIIRECNVGNVGGCWCDFCDGWCLIFEFWFFVLFLYVIICGKIMIVDFDFWVWDLEFGDGGKGVGEL